VGCLFIMVVCVLPKNLKHNFPFSSVSSFIHQFMPSLFIIRFLSFSPFSSLFFAGVVVVVDLRGVNAVLRKAAAARGADSRVHFAHGADERQLPRARVGADGHCPQGQSRTLEEPGLHLHLRMVRLGR
jgi:hypothetical protein